MRHSAATAICVALLSFSSLSHAQSTWPGLISQTEAHRYGLQRAWLTHVSLDRARDRVANLQLDGPNLFVQTDKSLLDVLDAETGGRLWTAQIGHRDYPASPPAANEKFVAVVNGTTLYVLDRSTGRTLREERLRFVPTGYVALSQAWAYVPGLIGQVEVFGLEKPDEKWNCGSYGQIHMPPLVARSALVWGTSKGHVYFASPSQGTVNFRLQTNGPVGAPMGYWPPKILAASRDGFLYAIHERSGETMWRFSVGTAVNEAPVVIDGSVYLVPESGGLHCLDVEDGSVRWMNPKAMRMLAVTPTFLYAADRFGNTLILDVKTGGHMATLETWQHPIKYTNLQNDRLYLGTSTGLLMCLRELPLKEPIQHLLPAEATPAQPATPGDMGMPGTTAPSQPAENPFGAPPQP